MRTLKLALASLFAAFAMGVLVQPASASDVTFFPGGALALTSSDLRFESPGGVMAMTCPTTLEATLDNAAVPLAAGSEIGSLDWYSSGPCRGGSMTLLMPGDPMPVRIVSLAGTAPAALTSIRVEVTDFGAVLFTSVFGVRAQCLYAGTLVGDIPLAGSNLYAAASLTLVRTTWTLAAGFSPCQPMGSFTGTFTFDPVQAVIVS